MGFHDIKNVGHDDYETVNSNFTKQVISLSLKGIFSNFTKSNLHLQSHSTTRIVGFIQDKRR
jgi:hypothetical protein